MSTINSWDNQVLANNITLQGGSIDIGADIGGDGTIAIGTTATAGRTITIGNVIAATAVNMRAGAGNINLTGAVVSANQITITVGDMILSSGKLTLPTTTSTVGQITINAARFMHAYGTQNVFLGSETGNFTLTASRCTAAGYQALTALTSSDNNTAFGWQALSDVTAGAANNTAIGTSSMNSSSTCNDNVAVGATSLYQVSGDANTAVGTAALNRLGVGDSNTAIGWQAGINYTTTETNNICIGHSVTGTIGESNVTRIGSIGSVTACYIAGIDGVNVGSVATIVTEASSRLGTATITAGSGISITPGANTITIAALGSGITWSAVTTPQTAADSKGYFTNDVGVITVTLPAAAAVGMTFEVCAMSAGGWTIAQLAGQSIRIGALATTPGAGGSISSTLQGDWIELVCDTANTHWMASVKQGNLIVV